ncbi:MAG: hypothetical protein KFH87_08115 [Bacteroidetes bacterium]|nr:hypothetical protein [Bacteroidota bacterium]
MRYQQTPVARLSKAAKFLEQDGEWHPFVGEEGVWYRVRNRDVQRIRLEAGETEELLRLVDRLDPLPARALREGFREELRFVVRDDHYLLAGMLLRAYVGWDMLATAAREMNVQLAYLGGNALRCDIRIDEWSTEAVTRALVLARACARVAAQLAVDAREGIPHIPQEITGLLHAAVETFMDEIGPLRSASPPDSPHSPEQTSLFGEE